MRKIIVSSVLAFTALALTMGSAWAFECYNTQRSATGNTAAANSPAKITIKDALIEFVGLCPEGADHVIAGLNEDGFRTDILINGRSLMAGGLEKQGDPRGQLHDGKGIDHLSEDFFGAVEELAPGGFALC